MNKDIVLPFDLPSVARKKVSVGFDGGQLSSDAGVLLLRGVEKKLGLTDRLASCMRAVQRRLDEHPEKMRQRRETVEHPFGTIKARMGATHFLMKTLPRVASEMALHVLAYNLTRVMNIMGVKPLMAAMRA